MNSERDTIEALWRALIEAHGGEATESMVNAWVSGMSMRAVAKAHGCSVSTVHARVTRLLGAIVRHGVEPPEQWRVRARVRRWANNDCNAPN